MTLDSKILFQGIGYLGQGFFFARFFIQWWLSEKARRVVVPTIFWTLSLYGGVLAMIYAIWKEDPVFIVGAAFPLVLYPRNLMLARQGRPLGSGALWAFALGILLVALATFVLKLDEKFRELPLVYQWIGGVGQLLWTLRFPLQWWISERRGVATLPPSFFGVSLAGSILLLIYSIWTKDLIFILGQVLTPFLNARNLMLGRKNAPSMS